MALEESMADPPPMARTKSTHLPPAEFDALLDKRETRVGHDAVKLDVCHTLLDKALLDAGEKTGVTNVAASPVDEGLVATELLDETTGLQLGVLTETTLVGTRYSKLTMECPFK